MFRMIFENSFSRWTAPLTAGTDEQEIPFPNFYF